MKIKCRYCGSMISDTCETCPNCGAVNVDMVKGGGTPTTIQELKDFCRAKNLPLEKMRFFIGENRKEPKCFGIYEESGYFTVYKNKADGTRSVRYEGCDEAYAVEQIYDKMKEEVVKRKVASRPSVRTSTPSASHSSYNSTNGSYHSSQQRRRKREFDIANYILAIAGVCMIFFTLTCCFNMVKGLDWSMPAWEHDDRVYKGYYEYLGDYYYYDGYGYYIYNWLLEDWIYYGDLDSLPIDNSYRMRKSDAYDLFYDDPYFDGYDPDYGYDYYWNSYYDDYYNYDSYDNYYDYENYDDNYNSNSYWDDDDDWSWDWDDDTSYDDDDDWGWDDWDWDDWDSDWDSDW